MRGCDNGKIHISSNFLLSICLLIMLDTLLLVWAVEENYLNKRWSFLPFLHNLQFLSYYEQVHTRNFSLN